MQGSQQNGDETRSDTTDSTSYVRARWAESIHTALKENEVRRTRKEQESTLDEFGEQVTRILNQTPEFNGPQHYEEQQFNPLFSRQNLQDLRQHFTLSGVVRFPALMVTRIWDACCFLTKSPKNLQSTLVFFLGTIAITMFLLVLVCHNVLVWLIRILLKACHIVITFLVDVEELQVMCPASIVWMWTKLVAIARAIDDFVLRGRKHAGREWNSGEHLWKGDNEAQSRREVLWKCPPPSVRHGRRRCLDSKRMPDEWSQDTKKHVIGINYCYVLLRADYVRRQRKYERMVQESQAESNARRAAFARAKSQSFEPPTLQHRGLVSNNCEESHENPTGNVPQYRRTSSTLVETPKGTSIRAHGVMGHLDSIEIKPRAFSYLAIEDPDHDSDDGDDEAGSTSSIGSGYILDDFTLMASPKKAQPSLSRECSIRSDESDVDLDWLDVGTRIGIRLLNSEHVQKAVASQETAERIYDLSKKVESQLNPTTMNEFEAGNATDGKNALLNLDTSIVEKKKEPGNGARASSNLRMAAPPPKPVHTMWTSPAAVARQQSETSIASISDEDDDGFSGKLIGPLSSNRDAPLFFLSASRPPRSPDLKRDNQSLDRNKLMKSTAPKTVDSELYHQAHKVNMEGSSIFHEIGHCASDVGHIQAEPRDENDIFPRSRSFSREGAASPLRRESFSPNAAKQAIRRPNLQSGTKIVVPILPKQPGVKMMSSRKEGSMFQMATVVKSRRIHLRTPGRRHHTGASYTNCLSVTVKLDKSFLRGADFAEMTFRVRDEWSNRYMPRHSKFPIGACVATSYGLGVLVGWRVEDDIHVVGSFWQHRGAGSAHAYLNRDAIHGVVEASVGFDVETNLGSGTVVAYVRPGKDFRGGRFFVHVKEGRNKDQVLEFARSNILSCLGARYIPVIELLREAAQYQLLVDRYKAALRQQNIDGERQLSEEELFMQTCSRGAEILWNSFLKAVEEDKEFDRGLSKFVTSVIGFLESLDHAEEKLPAKHDAPYVVVPSVGELDDAGSARGKVTSTDTFRTSQMPGFWFMNDWFGGIFQESQNTTPPVATSDASTYIDEVEAAKSDEYYKHAFAIVRSLMRTVSIARASCVDEPNLRLALSICYEFLLFVKTVLKVQQRNVTQQSLKIWKRTLDEIADTLGPIKERLQKIGTGLAERMEQHGKKAKVRILRFVDVVLSDERLMAALDRDDWETSIERVEDALVKSKLLEEESRAHIHKTIMFIYSNTNSTPSGDNAATRYGKKIATLATTAQWMSSPRRAFLTMLRSDAVLELMERLLVRVFRHDSFASRMLTIHASNFKSLRQLRMLKDFTIAGKLWLPILDAANDELHWAVSNMPESARDLMVPLSQLFSLCVSQFHKLGDGDLTADWLKFLMEDEAVELINEIDVKIILAVEAACKEIKEVMVVLPYYPSIDDDILNLIDEVDLEEFLKEASDAIEDADRLTDFVREKSTIAIERFLDWIPKMSIPVKRRELGDGWVLTCRGEGGGDLTLSDVIIKRENLCCQVLGGETMFFPMFGHDHSETESIVSGLSSSVLHEVTDAAVMETSILDHIRVLLEKAHNEGCWVAGCGGVEKPPSDRYVAFVLGNMPVTDVINSSIEVWRNLEIDDDELLEIVIREVSYQIQWHEMHPQDDTPRETIPATLPKSKSRKSSRLFDAQRVHRRFNPRNDPTILYFEMNKLTLNLERFHFRIEKLKQLTIFDPVFEGQGTLRVRNISMRLRVECRKERVINNGSESTIPFLHLQKLDIGLEKVKFKVKDTGADWILNQVVKGFEENITRTVEENLKDQVKDQIRVALEHLNSYFTMNPDLLLGILGITMDDLEENVVLV